MNQAQDQAQDSGPVITNLASSGHMSDGQTKRPARPRPQVRIQVDPKLGL